MLIPLRHENMQGRRWPVITIGLIALNTVIFLGTHWKMDEQAPELGEVRTHIVLLAAMHPELNIQGKAQDLVTTVQTKNPVLWKQKRRKHESTLLHLVVSDCIRFRCDRNLYPTHRKVEEVHALLRCLRSTAAIRQHGSVSARYFCFSIHSIFARLNLGAGQ